jgi:hypothetical protein
MKQGFDLLNEPEPGPEEADPAGAPPSKPTDGPSGSSSGDGGTGAAVVSPDAGRAGVDRVAFDDDSRKRRSVTTVPEAGKRYKGIDHDSFVFSGTVSSVEGRLVISECHDQDFQHRKCMLTAGSNYSSSCALAHWGTLGKM